MFNNFRSVLAKAGQEFVKKEKDAINYIKNNSWGKPDFKSWGKPDFKKWGSYVKDKAITKEKLKQFTDNIKQNSKRTIRYQFKQLPYYTYVVTKTGIKYHGVTNIKVNQRTIYLLFKIFINHDYDFSLLHILKLKSPKITIQSIVNIFIFSLIF